MKNFAVLPYILIILLLISGTCVKAQATSTFEQKISLKDEATVLINRLPVQFTSKQLTTVALRLKHGESKQALEILHRIHSKQLSGQHRVSYFLLFGLSNLLENDWQGARDSFMNLNQINGSNSDIYYMIALTYSTKGEYKAAIVNLKEALWFSKYSIVKRAEVYYALARSYEAIGDSQQQLETLEQLYADEPAFVPGLLALAKLRRLDGKRAEALKLLRTAVQENPEDRLIRLELVQTIISDLSHDFSSTELQEADKLIQSELANYSTKERLNSTAYLISIQILLIKGELAQAQKLISAGLKNKILSCSTLRSNLNCISKQKKLLLKNSLMSRVFKLCVNTTTK
jgi:tetratricopeptide (TPR) repeat protein